MGCSPRSLACKASKWKSIRSLGTCVAKSRITESTRKGLHSSLRTPHDSHADTAFTATGA
eukprot:6194694-Amphidinium_carterae.1